MARLTHPTAGTVIHVDESAVEKRVAAGWVLDKGKPEAKTEAPRPRSTRSRSRK